MALMFPNGDIISNVFLFSLFEEGCREANLGSARFRPKGFHLQACDNASRRYTGLAFQALKRPFDGLFTFLWLWPDTHPNP